MGRSQEEAEWRDKNHSNIVLSSFSLCPVMVNFKCQLDWIIWCLDVWLTIVLGVSVRVFQDEISRLSKAYCPPQCGWASCNPLKAWIEQNTGVERILSARLRAVSLLSLDMDWAWNHTVSPPRAPACQPQINGIFLAVFWTCFVPLLSSFSLLQWGCPSYVCPTKVFWKHITCLVFHIQNWRGTYLRVDFTLTLTHVWFRDI